MKEKGGIKVTVQVCWDEIVGIDTEIFIDGKWELLKPPKNSVQGEIFPGWSYVMPITHDVSLHIKLMKKEAHNV